MLKMLALFSRGGLAAQSGHNSYLFPAFAAELPGDLDTCSVVYNQYRDVVASEAAAAKVDEHISPYGACALRAAHQHLFV